MDALFAVRNELIALVATSAAILLAGMVLRNPLGPKIMKTEFAAHAAGLVLVALLLVATTYALQGFAAAGLGHAGAAIAVVVTLVVSILLLWKAFQVGERLRRADAGQSPFTRLHGASDAQASQRPHATEPPLSR